MKSVLCLRCKERHRGEATCSLVPIPSSESHAMFSHNHRCLGDILVRELYQKASRMWLYVIYTENSWLREYLFQKVTRLWTQMTCKSVKTERSWGTACNRNLADWRDFVRGSSFKLTMAALRPFLLKWRVTRDSCCLTTHLPRAWQKRTSESNANASLKSQTHWYKRQLALDHAFPIPVHQSEPLSHSSVQWISFIKTSTS
jgi:hypothetical protein